MNGGLLNYANLMMGCFGTMKLMFEWSLVENGGELDVFLIISHLGV